MRVASLLGSIAAVTIILAMMTATPAVRGGFTSKMTSPYYKGNDFQYINGGASVVLGHGAPGDPHNGTGSALRSGGPNHTSTCTFPYEVLTPGSTVTAVAIDYRYIVGYEKAPSGLGSNFTFSIVSDATPDGALGTVLYSSPHLTEYSYALNEKNYSTPMPIRWTGSVKVPPVPAGHTNRTRWGTSRLRLTFQNNDRNVQIAVGFRVNVTCTGAEDCLAATGCQPRGPFRIRPGCAPAPPAPAPPPGPPVPPPPPTPPAPPGTLVNLFSAGEAGIGEYRIPSLVSTTNGTLPLKKPAAQQQRSSSNSSSSFG
jgi:hypothetical protein